MEAKQSERSDRTGQMATQARGVWLILAAVLLLMAAPAARADWVDNFDQPTFDARWGLDMPNPGLGDITLDTVNDEADFRSYGNIDMWGARNNAPILWTPSSAGDFYLETHVTTTTSQTRSVAGITVYANADGANPDFGLGLNQWGSATGIVHLQGLGDNNPSVSTSALGGGQAWLRLECDRDGGAGGLDRYTAKYKLNAADPWSTLTTYDRDTPNARMGLFLKGNAAGKVADFSYAAGSDPPPPPPPPVNVGLWRLGDDDPGAAAGSIGNPQTLDTTNLNRSGDPTYSSNTPGPGSALSMALDGSGDFYSVGSVVSTATDNFGIEAWVNANSTSGNEGIAYNGNTSNAGWGLFRIGGNYGALYGGKAIFGSAPVTTGQWTHVALVRDGGFSTFYVDGVPAGSYGGAPNVPAGSFVIGANNIGTEEFDGLIDHVRVFTFDPGEFNASQHLTLSLPSPEGDIPEPATMAMLGLAVAGIGAYVRRRKKLSTMVIVALAAAMLFVGAGAARADWVDNFDQPTFDARWGLDMPNPGLGDITLDTVNDWAHLEAYGGTDMWTARNNAPILWTGAEDTFFMETHVMSPTSQNGSVAGITVYGAPDGTKPNFSFGLDHWSSTNRMVKLQGLGTNNPAISVPATGGQAWLRLECAADAGAGGVDRYTAKYKLNAPDPWSTLATLDRDVADSRMGLFLKTSGGGRSADFSYAAGTDPPPPPPPVLATWDFESGDLTGWNIVNTVHGNNQVFTTPGNMPTQMPATGYNNATVQGDYFVRTWDGNVLGNSDVPTGIVESDPFVLGPDANFSMLVGGGGHGFSGDPDSPNANMTALTLERLVGPNDWEMIFVESGGGNALSARFWDAGAYEGETVRLRIYDTHTGGWGHIGVDNIIYSARPTQPHVDIPEPATMALLGLAVAGLGGYLRRRKKLTSVLVVALAAGMLFVGAGAARAATVTAVGTIQDDAGNEISQWRTAATAKTLDADGDNIYGSDAKLFYRVMGDYGSYVQYISSEQQVGPYGGYAEVDHPNDSPTNIQVRTTTSGNVGVGTLRNMFTFAINGTPPALGFRVGVAFDGLDGAGFSPQEIRLTQTTGGIGTDSIVVEPFRNNTLDMAFFDVTGAVVGDRFTVQGVSGAGGYATHQIVTWDALTVAPPPPPPPPPVGDVIKLDFSTAGDGDGGSLADWNQTPNAVAPIPAGSVVRHGDGAVIPGVGISFSGGGGGWNNDGASGNWAGTAADPYYILGADDIYYGPGALTTTFSGLDPSLTYNVRIANLIGNNPGAVELFTVTDGAGTQTSSTLRGARWAAATLEAGGSVFTGLSPDALGNLSVTVQNTANGGGYYPLNAIVVEAVGAPTGDIPEPATMALLGLAVAGLGGYMRRRTRA